jgi:hypothetical protein
VSFAWKRSPQRDSQEGRTTLLRRTMAACPILPDAESIGLSGSQQPISPVPSMVQGSYRGGRGTSSGSADSSAPFGCSPDYSLATITSASTPGISWAGRDSRDGGTRRTSAPPVADTRRKGYPAWQRARYPSELSVRVVWRSRLGGSLGIRQPEPDGYVRSADAILSRQVFVAQQQFLIDETCHK